jgi:hypothetical protein
MPKSKSRRKKSPKRVLALPDLEHAKTAVLNSLTSISGQRTYEHASREFVTWYCSQPRLAFNRTVVLRYRIHLEQLQYAPATGLTHWSTRRDMPIADLGVRTAHSLGDRRSIRQKTEAARGSGSTETQRCGAY